MDQGSNTVSNYKFKKIYILTSATRPELRLNILIIMIISIYFLVCVEENRSAFFRHPRHELGTNFTS